MLCRPLHQTHERVKRVAKYLLDANVFIQAHRSYYPLDICPGFWKALLQQHDHKRVFSIDRIKKEITEGGDQLKQWANQSAPKTFFKKTADTAVVAWYQKMVEWVSNEPQYTTGAKAEFANVADGWLVAYAKSNGLVVVTQEVPSPSIKRKVPIPNLCDKFDVEYVNTVEMLRQLGVQFVLGKRSP